MANCKAKQCSNTAVFSGENIIIGGDFNCPFAKDDKEGGTRSLSSKKNVVAEVKIIIVQLRFRRCLEKTTSKR